MKIVVGLGNPGSRYAGTRHNVGYAVIDSVASGPGVSSFQNRFDSQVAEWTESDGKVLLVKPETFMNLSGRAVREIIDFYQVERSDVLVVCEHHFQDVLNCPKQGLSSRRVLAHCLQPALDFKLPDQPCTALYDVAVGLCQLLLQLCDGGHGVYPAFRL